LKAKPKKKFKRIHTIIIVAVLLIAALSYAVYTLTYTVPNGPGPVEIEVLTDKPSYVQGENITFSIYVNNPHDWRVPYPSLVTYQIGNESTGVNIDYTLPYPSFPAHSRTFFENYSWNQMVGSASNRMLVEPGNYTLTVTLNGSVDYGTPKNFSFEIKPNAQP
jgi:hypothetical protein